MFQIDALGEVVQLTVSEFHPEGIDEKFVEGGRRGWPIILSGPKSLLETGHPLPKFTLPDMPTEYTPVGHDLSQFLPKVLARPGETTPA